MKTSAVRFFALCALLGSLAVSSRAALIDFETTPAGGTPADNMPLAAAYNLAGGGTVTFFLDIDGNYAPDDGVLGLLVFEAYGNDILNGFSNDTLLGADIANGSLASQLGNFFLRQVQPGTPPPPFIIDYNTSQTIWGFSGEIWDIDGTTGNSEEWKVEVLDSANTLLTSQTSPPGTDGTLDGLPWVFMFTGLPAGADKLRITFTGTKTSGLGLAFNNFDPLIPVPEPGGAVLASLALLGFFVSRSGGRNQHRDCGAG